MKFVKEEEEKTGNFIFQKNKITLNVAAFVIIVLIALIIGVVISGKVIGVFGN